MKTLTNFALKEKYKLIQSIGELYFETLILFLTLLYLSEPVASQQFQCTNEI